MFFTLTRKRLFSLAFIAAITLSTTLANATPSSAAGGAGIVSGLVVDANNRPVSGADVVFVAPTGRYRTHTNHKGRFMIVGMFADTYTLIVRENGIVEINQPEIYVAVGEITNLGPIALADIARIAER
jgi:hypothetical protein